MLHPRARIAPLFAMCLLTFASSGAWAAAATDRNETAATFGNTRASVSQTQTRTQSSTSVGLGGTSAGVTREGNRTRVTVQSPPRGRDARTRTTVERGRWARMAVSRSEALTKLQEARRLQRDRREVVLREMERRRR